jgi:hypothetical protein
MEQKTITTTNGYTVVLKSFITGKEKRYISDAFLEDAIMGENGTFKMAPGKIHGAEDRAFEKVVVSVDGPSVDKTSSIADQVLNLPAIDTAEIIVAVNEVTEGKKKEASISTT